MEIDVLTSLLTAERRASDFFLREFILRDIPDYARARTDLERTTLLRSWVFYNTNFAVKTYQFTEVEPFWSPHVLQGTAGAQLVPHFKLETGDLCGHLSSLLIKIYELFGFRAGRAGWQAPKYGHTYPVVWINYKGHDRVIIQDPMHDCVLMQRHEPADFIAAIRDLVDGKLGDLHMREGNALNRRVLVSESELGHISSMPEFYTDQTPEDCVGDISIFRSSMKWDVFDASETAEEVRLFVDEHHLPRNLLSALIFATHGPSPELEEEMFAMRDGVRALRAPESE